MSRRDREADLLVAVLAEEAGAATLADPRAEHPEVERLFDYLRNRLSEDEGESLADHLAGCSTCTRQLLDLRLFAEASDGDGGGAPPMGTARVLTFDLEGKPAPGAENSRSARRRLRFRRGQRWLSQRVAASFMVATVVFSVRVGDRLAPVATGDQAIVVRDRTMRGQSEVEEVVVLPMEQWVPLSLVLDSPRPSSRYEIQLLSSGGSLLWQASVTVPEEPTAEPWESPPMYVPRARLPAGEVWVRVARVREDGSVEAGSLHPLEIRYGASA